MKELEKALDGAAEVPANHKTLTEAGVRWAAFALRNLVGDHLKKALNISAAISDFTALFEDEGYRRSRRPS